MELTHIGRYEIKMLIGQGGMSAVYLGYDPRSLREVAIKVLPPYYVHADKFRDRFEREAVMIALLEHPAIVPVYDMGEEDGQPYIVMRYMSGGSLSEKLKKGPIPLRECMEMYLRLAPALDTAHARGVTHRDVKPDNLLFDKYDNVFLSDFGLARLRETIGFTNISDGSIMGTPAYMSPEQIQGDREIDGRSDIYSMGVVLYQMLCGTVPFSGTTAASVMMMHLINPVPQIYDQNKTLPIAIQTVLDTAMAKNPKDRYQTAGEFAKALQAVTTGVHKKLQIQNIVDTPKKQPIKHTTLQLIPKKPASIDKKSNITPAKLPQLNGNKPPIPEETSKDQTATPLRTAASPTQNKIALASSTAQPETLKQKRRTIPLWAWLLSVAVVLVLSLTVFQWSQGGFPFSLLMDSNLNNPNNASVQDNPEAPASIISTALGQADKLAFLKDSNIWASDLDGSDLVQLTSDGDNKSHLHWSPDGQSIIYTSANCLNMVGLLTKQVLTLSCFSGIPSINAFDISPDGQNIALGLAQSDLYLLPYSQLFHLRQTSLPEDLPALAQCSYYAPYKAGDTLKAVNWSMTNGLLALLVSKPVDGINRDEISILDFSQCAASPLLVKEIQPSNFLFTLRGYFNHPEISSFSLNGNDQLLLNGYLNNDGFGNLQLFSLDQNQSQEITPNGSCCYRDVHWSPDGTYLFYTYQPESGGEVTLYYAPYSELDQPGEAMTALTLPAGFLANSLESLQPTLRTAH
jgi:serine/threonine protein kinase